jgi:uncharacterized membrane protein
MTFFHKRPTRNAKRRLALTLLIVLSVVAGSAYAVYAATKSDFGITAAPSSQTVIQGSSTSYTISISRSGGFSGTVALSASGLPSGATATFSPSSLTTGHDSATMTVQTSSSTPPSSYTVTVSGKSGNTTHSTPVTLVVPKPDFSIGAAPSSQTVIQGGSTSYTVSLARTGGFTGAVTLSASGLPSGATASFAPSAPSSSQTTSTMTVNVGSSTSPGTYTVTVTGKNGSLSHSATVTLVIPKPDFAISSAPSSQSVVPGASTTYTISASRSGGFSGTVSLSASGLPDHTSATFDPSSLTTGNDSSTLTLNTSTTTTPGTYTVTVTGTNGSLTHTTSMTVVVLRPDFSIAGNPLVQEIGQGSAAAYAVSVTRKNGFTGAVSLDVAGLPAGATASWSPSSTIPSSGTTSTLTVQTSASTPPGAYVLVVSATGSLPGGTATRYAFVALQVDKSNSFEIAGNLGASLSPGTKGPLNLSITNPNHFDIQVTSLSVSVRAATSKSGCSGSQNFAVDQYSGTYPLTVHPGTTSLSSLVSDQSKWPQVRMLNLPTNQDACKGATINFDYTGSATK